LTQGKTGYAGFGECPHPQRDDNIRNFANDLALEDWLFGNVLPVEEKLTPEDIYWGTLLGIAEMIKSGTTTFADMYLHMEEVARAVSETA